MDLLLLSSSTVYGSEYLEYCEADLRALFDGRREILFVPYARPGGRSHDAYTAPTRERFAQMGFRLTGLHEAASPVEAVRQAEGIFVGGGNTFVLLKGLYEAGVLEAIRARVAAGMPYAGSSAGSNVAGLTIGTTNDMPIVYPPAFDALGLVPFNLNPHYLDPDPASTHMGETRETRIREFHAFNARPVVGLREGAMLRRRGDGLRLLGAAGARLFRQGQEPEEYAPGADLSFLLRTA
jgi:dipeptidase E